MAITLADFNKIWASTSPLTPYSFSESNYKQGWNFIGSTPPARQMWDFLQKNNDEKMQYLANNYLPLSGGTLTGNNAKITMSNGESYVRCWGNGLYLGGTDGSNSSSLTLFTNSNASGFQINAGDGTTFKRMAGNPDGTLTWDNKEIERVSAKGTYGIRLESGIQICWGELTIPAGTADREASGTMTFQYPFANVNYGLTFGNDWCTSSNEYYRAEGRNTTNFKFTAAGVGTNQHRAFYIAIGYWK